VKCSKWLLVFMLCLCVQTIAAGHNQAGQAASEATRPRTDRDVLDQVQFAPQTGSQIPLSLRLREHGQTVPMVDLLADKPALLTFAWLECHNLCGLVLNGLASAVGEALGDRADDFRVMVVSLDADADAAALEKSQADLAQRYPDADIANRWHFLGGSQEAIRSLARSAGYGFTYDDRKAQYAHPAGVVALDRSGHIQSFRSGFNFRGQDIENMVNFPNGEAASTPPQPLLLLCYDYDPTTGQYSLAIVRLLRWVSVICLVLLALALWYWQRRGARHE